jgi:hypothetical protein
MSASVTIQEIGQPAAQLVVVLPRKLREKLCKEKCSASLDSSRTRDTFDQSTELRVKTYA